MKFIEKAIELQELCLRGNAKRNPEERKETAERNFIKLFFIVFLVSKNFQ